MANYKSAASIQHQPDVPRDASSEQAATDTSAKRDACPVDHKNMSKEQIAASMHKRNTDSPNTVYDVYGQQLDKSNMMPSTPNQLPSPGQKEPLSTHRVKSNIPKAGEQSDQTWTYPSPQMFYNALKRKGKADGVQESDMDTVVSVHNTMNEKTWEEVMQWERRFHCQQCENPKLKRFLGRPHDLSPAARFRVWFRGYPMPFDRHDWVVDRCGEEARYIIDYYYREGPDPIEIHVRPALDSPIALFDRIRNRAISVRDSIVGDLSSVQRPAEVQSIRDAPRESVVLGEQLDKEEFEFLSNLSAKDVDDIAKDVRNRCAKLNEAFETAGDDPAKMERANISANYCMAQSICRPQAAGFMQALESGKNDGEAYADMTSCLERFHIVARRVMLEAAGITQNGPEFSAQEAASAKASSEQSAAASSLE